MYKRQIFDYAKSQNVILFLDELDAIAKRRDDMGDLGELKRLVNVLLKELEECPVTCVIVGATNHPEILDKAIWRRFDRNIEIPMPGKEERRKLVERTLGNKFGEMKSDTIKFIVGNTETVSASEICKLCEHIKRQMVMNRDDLSLIHIYTIKNEGTDILFGQDFFYEELLDLKFKITPFSFFQTNSLGAEVLYQLSLIHIYRQRSYMECLIQ